jgi:hypothetical protein
MTESKSTEQKSTVKDRQEAAAKKDAEIADRNKVPARSKDDTLTVVLRDNADSTVDSVTKLIGHVGGHVTKSSGKKLTVALPAEPERQPDSYRQRIVDHVLADPLVEGVE